MKTALAFHNAFASAALSYDADGAARSAVSFNQVVKLPGTASNAIVTTIRSTPDTAAVLPAEISISGGSFVAAVPLTVTHQKLTGTGPMTLAKLRALTVQLTADPVTSAEIESGSTASRNASLTIELSHDGSDTTYFTDVRLLVNAPGQTSFFDWKIEEDLPADIQLTITVNDLDLKTQIGIFAAIAS